MKLKCLIGLHTKLGLTTLEPKGEMEVTYANGKKEKINLKDTIKLQVCYHCLTVFYKR